MSRRVSQNLPRLHVSGYLSATLCIAHSVPIWLSLVASVVLTASHVRSCRAFLDHQPLYNTPAKIRHHANIE
jgi:hypothetical protein